MSRVDREVGRDVSRDTGRDVGRDGDYARLLAAERAARAEAERARADAVAAAQAKGAFLATMSHELRTPLNAIIGYAELLDLGIFGAVTPGQHEHLERLRASARHLLGLVNDVLDLAKIDAGRLDVRRESAVTGSALAAALALVQPQATAKGIVVFDRHAGEPGVRYAGDEHRVQQILVNLLSNAVKFTPPGGQITIDCGLADVPDPDALPPDSPVHGPGPWAWVRVDDTGPGVAPEFLGRLFEPFVQEQGSYTREHGGTGLGLSISRRLARLMGGDLTVTASPSVPASAGPPTGPVDGPAASPTLGTAGRVLGASFTLWLPADVPTASAAGVAAGSEAAEATAPADTAGPAAGRFTEPTLALPGDAYPVVYALGVRLASMAEPVSVRYLGRLHRAQAAGDLPGAGRLADVQLLDHATPFVALVASQIRTLGEMRGRAPDLLGDAARVQRLMAELHGAQRRRLGWTAAQLEHDFVDICAEVEHALHAAVNEGATADAAPGPAGPPDAPDPARDGGRDGMRDGMRDAALAYAIEVSRHIFERAKRASVRAYDAARPDDAGGRPIV